MSEAEVRGTGAWSLQCQNCQKFFDMNVRLHVHGDNAHHWDVKTGVCCGSVERVELKSCAP